MKPTFFRVPKFNEHYEGSYDERGLLWRRLGAADKARNIATLTGDNPIGTVLEVGCGTGAVLTALATRGIGSSYVGVDLADPTKHTDPAALSLDLRQFDGKVLPFDADSFDFVYASHVIEHVPEPRAVLAEMARVGKRWMYVEVPCELHLRTSHKELQRSLDIGHINAYTPESFQLLLESSELKVTAIQIFDHSLAVHRFGTSPFRAAVKTVLRGGLLRTSPRLASRIFTYHCGALVSLEANAKNS